MVWSPTSPADTMRIQTVCAEVTLYLDTVEAAGRTPGTVHHYRQALRALARLANPAAATELDIRDFLDRYPNLNTRSAYLVVLRQFYGFCIKRGLLTADPTTHIPLPKTHPRRWPLISPAEFDRLREKAAPWLRVFISVLYYVGSRVSETCAIRAEHIYLEGTQGTVDFPRRKGGDSGFSAFGYQMAQELKTWLPGHAEWLFPHPQHPTQPISPGRVRYVLRQLGKAAGIPGILAPHRFRHTFTTNAVDGGWNQLSLQQQLGHRNPATTARYYRPSRKGLMSVYERAEKHQ